MKYTPLETTILLELKENIEQENGVDPMVLLMSCMTVHSTDIASSVTKTLQLLEEEELIRKVEGHDNHGVFVVLGYKATRDGLRAARTLSS